MTTVMRPAAETGDTADGRPPERSPAARVSAMAEGLSGSQILKIAAEIRAQRAGGTRICDLTVGDFDPAHFRIPRFLEDRITEALRRGETNYPPSAGMAALREAIAAFYRRTLALPCTAEQVVVTA